MSTLNIIKVGGNIIDHPEKLSAFLQDFAKLEGYNILVHGGGKVASQLASSMGLEVKMVEGRRVTDQEMLEVVTMVYAGLVNKKVVAQLQALGCNAMGFSGADGNAIQSHKRIVKTVDYGFVGDIDHVNGAMIFDMMQKGIVPVFSAITHDKQGQLLNTNADTIASSLAVALSSFVPTRLIYCFELLGVLKDINDLSSLIPKIDADSYVALKEEGVISKGMIPKLDNCFDAIAKGVSSVAICQAEKLLELKEGNYTEIK